MVNLIPRLVLGKIRASSVQEHFVADLTPIACFISSAMMRFTSGSAAARGLVILPLSLDVHNHRLVLASQIYRLGPNALGGHLTLAQPRISSSRVLLGSLK